MPPNDTNGGSFIQQLVVVSVVALYVYVFLALIFGLSCQTKKHMTYNSHEAICSP